MIYRWSKTTRKNTIIPTVTGTAPGSPYYNNLNVLQSTSAAIPGLALSSGVSEIVYTTRPKGFKNIRSNMCVHTNTRYKYTGDVNDYQIVNDLHPGKAGWYTKYYAGHFHAVTQHSVAVTTAKTAFGATLGPGYLNNNAQSWINSFAIKNKPDLTTFSLINNLIELDEIKALYGFWNVSSSLVRNLASTHLTYKFGLKPLIGDLVSLEFALRNLRIRLNGWKSSVGKEFKIHSKIVTNTVNKSGQFTFADAFEVCQWSGRLSQDVKAFLTYRPQPLAVFSKYDEALFGLMDSVGFEANPRILWDAIPFTFVVDWFFNVGKVLERFRFNALELPIVITDSFLQYKQTMEIESRVVLDVNHVGVSSSTSWPSCLTTENLFYRLPILPDYTSLADIGFRWPTLNQAELLLSLGTVLSTGDSTVRHTHAV